VEEWIPIPFNPNPLLARIAWVLTVFQF